MSNDKVLTLKCLSIFSKFVSIAVPHHGGQWSYVLQYNNLIWRFEGRIIGLGDGRFPRNFSGKTISRYYGRYTHLVYQQINCSLFKSFLLIWKQLSFGRRVSTVWRIFNLNFGYDRDTLNKTILYFWHTNMIIKLDIETCVILAARYSSENSM